MNSEFGKDSIFNNWYSKRQVTEEENALFKRINDLRITTTKKKPIETHRIISSIHIVPDNFNPAEFLNKNFMLNISETDKDGNQSLSFITESGETIEGETDNYKIVNNLLDNEDLYLLSEKYLRTLVGIFGEWMLIKSSEETK